MSIRRCQQEISNEEFQSWSAYFELQPFGEEVNDFRAAQLCAMVANLFSKHHIPVQRFMTGWTARHPQSTNEIKGVFMAIANACKKGGRRKPAQDADGCTVQQVQQRERKKTWKTPQARE